MESWFTVDGRWLAKRGGRRLGFQTDGLIGNSGVAAVTGSGSTWNNSGRLTVGRFGAGTLNIQNGGVVTASDTTFIAAENDSSGVATVSGTGSRWALMRRQWQLGFEETAP